MIDEIKLKEDINAFDEYRLDDHYVLYRQDSGAIHILDAVAYWVWSCVKSDLSAEEIAAILSENSDIDEERALEKINTLFLAWLNAAMHQREATVALEPCIREDSDALLQKHTGNCYQKVWYQFSEACVGVHYGDAELFEAINPILQSLVTHAQSPVEQEFILLQCEDDWILNFSGKTFSYDSLDEISSALVFQLVESQARIRPRLTVLHASAILYRNTGVVFVGESGAGKTTLAAALSCLGFTFLSDDVLPVENKTFSIIPVPVSSCLKSGSWPVIEEFYPEIYDLPSYQRGGESVRYLPVKSSSVAPVLKYMLLYPKYVEAADTKIESMSNVEKFVGIIQSQSLLKRFTNGSVVQDVIDWLSEIEAYKITYSDINKVAPAICSLVDVKYDSIK